MSVLENRYDVLPGDPYYWPASNSVSRKALGACQNGGLPFLPKWLLGGVWLCSASIRREIKIYGPRPYDTIPGVWENPKAWR